MAALQFSFIIPVYNRPQEIKELLESFLNLTGNFNYEIVIIEDGSTQTSEAIVQQFSNHLNLAYYKKENSGPGDSRNYGMQKAKGNYFIILDSDVILPPQYLSVVNTFLSRTFYDCYGGPDAAHKSFSKLQKAINFAMTSFISTGGIRGGKQQIENFQPRSFNMGLSQQAFIATKGFGNIHPGEDPDLSLRLTKMGFKTTLIQAAFVYHKRRISWNKFYKQVRKFGLVRPILNQWHPNSKSLTYWFPFLFVFGFCLAVLLYVFNIKWAVYSYFVYFIIAFVLALIQTKSISIAVQAVFAICIQFVGYGLGFITSTIKVNCLGQDPKKAFPKLFFNKK